MYIDKRHILYFLIGLLGLFYALNIFFMANITNTFVIKPVKLSFLVLQPPIEDCVGCVDGNNIVYRIDATHNIKYKTQTAVYDSDLAKKAIETYGITNLPAVIITGDITNENIVGSWKALSAKEREGSMVIENVLPYYDLETKTSVGVVDAIIVTDGTCTDCFNEKTYINIFKQFGIVMNDIKTYDISSPIGKEFVQKYNITKVPMVILSSGAGNYTGFNQAWSEVGTFENNEWYVFREVQKLGLKYKDI